jgi:hypothetical protein
VALFDGPLLVLGVASILKLLLGFLLKFVQIVLSDSFPLRPLGELLERERFMSILAACAVDAVEV